MLSLSVIIPVLNENQHLEKLIPYLLNLEDIDEIIIVQASQNKTSFHYDAKKLKIVTSTFTRRSLQMNEGAKLASGHIFCFLHADVMPHTKSFSAIKETIGNGISFGFFPYNFSPDNFLLKINAHFTRKNGPFSGGGDQIHFFSRELFESLSGYEPHFEIMEDFELFRRIKRNKIPFQLMELPATVSSRKYDQNSYLRVNFTNLVAFILFHFHVKNTLIKRWCRFMLY